MPTIEMLTELPGPKSSEIIARKERVVCDPLDQFVVDGEPVVVQAPLDLLDEGLASACARGRREQPLSQRLGEDDLDGRAVHRLGTIARAGKMLGR